MSNALTRLRVSKEARVRFYLNVTQTTTECSITKFKMETNVINVYIHIKK